VFDETLGALLNKTEALGEGLCPSRLPSLPLRSKARRFTCSWWLCLYGVSLLRWFCTLALSIKTTLS